MKPYHTPEVESGIWVMRQLGLKGDIPYVDKITPAIGIIVTSKPHPNHQGPGPRTARVGELKPEALVKHIKRFRKQMNIADGQGNWSAGWHSDLMTLGCRASLMILPVQVISRRYLNT
jgi:hypothetical protein